MKVISVKDLKSKIDGYLSDYLKNDGYLHNKSKGWFEAHSGKFRYIFYPVYTKWSDHIAIHLNIYLELTEVEQVFKQILGKSNFLTMGNDIGVIYNSDDGRKVINRGMPILIFQSEDSDAACESLVD